MRNQAPATPSTGSWKGRLPAVAVVIAVALAWSGSLDIPFLLDDHESIVQNPGLRSFWSFGWLTSPADIGETVGGRPILGLTLALNYALGGLSVQGYHAFNLIIHAGSALLLLAILRSTLARLGTEHVGLEPHWPALAATLLWALHPLQTPAVSYVVQRAESLSAFFLLLTLYSLQQNALNSRNARKANVWSWIAVTACLLGVGTKETAAVIPLLALLYDRCFLTGSFHLAWQQRSRLHLSLFASWIPLMILVVLGGGRGGSAGLGGSLDPWSYLLTQCEAIVQYLRLSVWPDSLVFDYGVPVVSGLGQVWLKGLFLLGLLGLSIWGLIRNTSWGFVGTCFFLLLAPSSSVVPVATQTMAEHRMYLPLACVVVLFCVPLWRLGSRGGLRIQLFYGLTMCLLAIALGVSTHARNAVYRDSLTLWSDTVEKRPDNPRAHNNLGMALLERGRANEATEEFRKTLELNPKHAFAHYNLGVSLLLSSNKNTATEDKQALRLEAEQAFLHALQNDPSLVGAHVNLGRLLAEQSRQAEAKVHYRKALELDGSAHDARVNLAALLLAEGQVGEAKALLVETLAAQPGLAEAHYHLGLLQEKQGLLASAETELREAIRLKPDFAAAYAALGNCLIRRGDRSAEPLLRKAIELDNSFAEAWFALGNLLASQERMEEAIVSFRTTLQHDPSDLRALNNLGNCQLVTGQLQEAIQSYQRYLQQSPNSESVRSNLEYAKELQRQAGTTSP